MEFGGIDMVVLVGYLCIMMGIGIWFAFKEKNESAKDYFLASSSLPWWAVGGSLIASNISTEQILGMNGSGYVMGLAIGAYELMAALTLMLVAKFLLPIFIDKGIYTMPQFLEERFNKTVRTIMAFFWVALFVIVNITTVLYLGALAMESIIGISMFWGILALVVYSATLSIFGGLKAVVWTDVIQVVILIIGGFTAAFMVLSFVGGGSVMGGLHGLMEQAPGHFDMILDKNNPSYKDLPGISVLIGGLWIANIYYWGNNQYIIQRALASKSLKEAQKGVAFAAIMKLIIPFFAVIPGIAAYVILKDPEAYGFTGAGIDKADQAFPWVLNNFVQTGFKGLVLAALIAAIGSSVSSIVNSASTIFTLDIYKSIMSDNRSDEHYVTVGRVSAVVALLVGALLAPLLGSLEQVFQYIQEYTGYISPGVVAVFMFGMYWKKTNSVAALMGIVISIPLSATLSVMMPDFPFLMRMALCFTLISIIIIILSLVIKETSLKDVVSDVSEVNSSSNDFSFKMVLIVLVALISLPSGIRILAGDVASTGVGMGILILGLCGVIFALLLLEKGSDDRKAIQLNTALFKTESIFNITFLFVCAILTAIYYILW